MMRAVIVDDERLARNELRRLLTAFPDVEIVGEARDADEAERTIADLAPDVVFLDIRMPGRDGFALLAALDRAPRVVFTTAYDEFALEAFAVNALDYLLKPIDPARLAEAVARLRSDPSRPRPSTPRVGPEEKVFLRDGDRCWFVRVADIRLFESEGNYTRVFFDTHRPLIPRSLSQVEERLDPGMFFRASRKHIVNLAWIEAIEPSVAGGLVVRLSGCPDIEVSRRQSQVFRDRKSL